MEKKKENKKAKKKKKRSNKMGLHNSSGPLPLKMVVLQAGRTKRWMTGNSIVTLPHFFEAGDKNDIQKEQTGAFYWILNPLP